MTLALSPDEPALQPRGHSRALALQRLTRGAAE